MKRNDSFIVTTTIHVVVLAAAALGAMVFLSNQQAAKRQSTIYLTDGTSITGTISHDFRNIWRVKNASGETLIPEKRIAVIEYGSASSKTTNARLLVTSPPGPGN